MSEILAKTSGALRGIPGVSVVKEFHITLKFLGDIDEDTLRMVKTELSKINAESFEVRIGNIGFFPSRNKARVVWAGANSEGLVRVASDVESMIRPLGFKPEKFYPHITLARIKYVRDRNLLESALSKLKLPDLGFYVSEFFLEKSVLTASGPIYSDLAVFSLS